MSQTWLQVCGSCQCREEGNEKGKHKLGNSVRGQGRQMGEAESGGKGAVWELKLASGRNCPSAMQHHFSIKGVGGRNPSSSLLVFCSLSSVTELSEMHPLP